MKITFTGVQDLTPENERVVKEVMRECVKYLDKGDDNEFITGAALGVDTLCAVTALEMYPWCYHHLVVPAQRHNRDLVAYFIEMNFRSTKIIVEKMPDGTDYMDRNDTMIGQADMLIAFPATNEELMRSGTWATIRRAQKKEIPIYAYPLDGDEAWHENVPEEVNADG